MEFHDANRTFSFFKGGLFCTDFWAPGRFLSNVRFGVDNSSLKACAKSEVMPSLESKASQSHQSPWVQKSAGKDRKKGHREKKEWLGIKALKFSAILLDFRYIERFQ